MTGGGNGCSDGSDFNRNQAPEPPKYLGLLVAA